MSGVRVEETITCPCRMGFTLPIPLLTLVEVLLLFNHQVVSGSSVTLWTVACQASLPMEFPRQEYWSGLLVPSPVKSTLSVIKCKMKCLLQEQD